MTLSTGVGGTQWIRVTSASSWLFGGGASVGPFSAESSDPSVLSVESVDLDGVRVRASAPGVAHLRIVDEDGRLLDRISLLTAEVSRIELRGEPHSVADLASWSGPWAFRRGGEGIVVFALHDDTGERLADESALPVAADGVEPSAWDTARASFDAPGDELRLEIDLAIGRRIASAPLVDGIDRIERASYLAESLVWEPQLRVGQTGGYCFLPFAGERAVAGVVFDVSVEGPIELVSPPLSDRVPGCVSVEATAPGDAAVIVRADGVEERTAVRIFE